MADETQDSVLDAVDDVSVKEPIAVAEDAVVSAKEHIAASNEAVAAAFTAAQVAAEQAQLEEAAAIARSRGPAEVKFADLDKNRPYGRVQPPQGRQHYQQDGKYFDHLGVLVEGE